MSCRRCSIHPAFKLKHLLFSTVFIVILLDTLPSCNDISEKYVQPPVDAILIIDGSRSEFENLQLIS